MAKYRFTAKNTEGKILRGTYFAADENDLRQILANQEYYLINYSKQNETSDFWSLSGSVKPDDLVNFARQFGIMLKAGISISTSIETLQQTSTSPKLKKTLETVYSDIMNGLSVSNAFRKHDKVFPEFFINMTAVGEMSGSLDVIMEKLAAYYENDTRMKRKAQTAMIYPTFLLILVFGVMIVLSLFVIPMFTNLFDQFGATNQLPLVTVIVSKVSNFIRTNILEIILVILVLILLIPILKKTKGGRYFFDKMKITLPILKSINNAVITSRFASGFSTLLQAGIPLVNAMDTMAHLLGNVVIEEKMMTVKSEIERGQSVSKSIKTINYFPKMLEEMISVGENSGQLEQVLETTSQFFDEQVDREIKKATTFIEPVMIMIVGLIVAVALLAVFLPMLGLMDAINNVSTTVGY